MVKLPFSQSSVQLFGRTAKQPDGKAKPSKVVHGGAALVWPLIQDYAYISLKPMPINIDLKGALSLQNIRINVPSTFTVGVSKEPSIMANAAERLLGFKIPEIEKSLALVKHLKKKKEEGESVSTRYNLADTIFAKAELDCSSGIVNLWLGANVMLEYTYNEAIALLSSKKLIMTKPLYLHAEYMSLMSP